MKRWARLTSAGRWGWQIEMLSHDGERDEFFTMVEERVVHAWTERGARRKAERMIRRRVARDHRQRAPIVIELSAPPVYTGPIPAGWQKLDPAGVAMIPAPTSSTPPPPPAPPGGLR